MSCLFVRFIRPTNKNCCYDDINLRHWNKKTKQKCSLQSCLSCSLWQWQCSHGPNEEHRRHQQYRDTGTGVDKHTKEVGANDGTDSSHHQLHAHGRGPGGRPQGKEMWLLVGRGDGEGDRDEGAGGEGRVAKGREKRR